MSAPMEAGREMDALIAEEVMGYVWKRSAWTFGSPARHARVLILPTVAAEYGDSDLRGDESDALAVERVPRYSTSVAAAWTVVERMRETAPDRYRNLSLVAYCYNRTYATFDVEALADYSADTWSEANGEHATPLAICMAALSARRASPGPETPR